MALINCKECRTEVSSEAVTCPKCGYKAKPIGCSGALVLIFLTLAVVSLFLPKQNTNISTNSTSISSNQHKNTDPGNSDRQSPQFWINYPNVSFPTPFPIHRHDSCRCRKSNQKQTQPCTQYHHRFRTRSYGAVGRRKFHYLCWCRASKNLRLQPVCLIWPRTSIRLIKHQSSGVRVC